MDISLHERLIINPIPNPDPRVIIQTPIDSSYPVDETSVKGIIRSQSDYVNSQSILTHIHSTMKNSFYSDLCSVLDEENQNIIDHFNKLKTLFDIDYYDGDQVSFLDKITNLATLLKFKIPIDFLPFTNIDSGYDSTVFVSHTIDTSGLISGSSSTLLVDKDIPLLSPWTINQYANYTVTIYTNTLGVITSKNATVISNGYNTLTLNIPWTYISGSTYTYTLYGNINNITKQNDFLRNIIKRVYLLRRWVGSLYGYKLPVKMMHRIGAVQLGALNLTYNLVATTDRIYRYVDKSKYFYLLPTSSDSIYPNTGNVDGYGSYSKIRPQYYYWDTGLTYDQTLPPTIKVSWDMQVAIPNTSRRLLVEMALDRLLTYPNSINSNPNVCLLENIFLDSTTILLKDVTKAQDIVLVGSQLTLLTGTDGTFNSVLCADNHYYTHPNIKAKFQVNPTLWSALATSGLTKYPITLYVKVGTGGFTKDGIGSLVSLGAITSTPSSITSNSNFLIDSTKTFTDKWINAIITITGGTSKYSTNTVVSTSTHTLTLANNWTIDTTSNYILNQCVDGNVFVNKVSETPGAINKTNLTDLQIPLFKVPIMTSEVTPLSSYSLINTVVHNRELDITIPISYSLNGSKSAYPIQDTVISFSPIDKLAKGTVKAKISIDNFLIEPIITNPLGITLATTYDSNGFILKFTGSSSLTGDFTIKVQRFADTISHITNFITTGVSAVDVATAVMVNITTHIKDYTITRVGATITMVPLLPEIHQQILIYEDLDPISKIYNASYTIKQFNIGTLGTTDGSACNVVISNFIQDTTIPYLYSATIESIFNITTGVITVNGYDVQVYNTDTFETLAKRIASIKMGDWAISWSFNDTTNTYILYLEFVNAYTSLTQPITYGGYVGSFEYDSGLSTYMPTVQQQILKFDPLGTNSYGDPNYINIDHDAGTITMKLRINPFGVLGSFSDNSEPANTYTIEKFTTELISSVSISDSNVAISELGLFGTTNGTDFSMVAYATFPSIIYNPNKYHLGLNLLIGG